MTDAEMDSFVVTVWQENLGNPSLTPIMIRVYKTL